MSLPLLALIADVSIRLSHLEEFWQNKWAHFSFSCETLSIQFVKYPFSSSVLFHIRLLYRWDLILHSRKATVFLDLCWEQCYLVKLWIPCAAITTVSPHIPMINNPMSFTPPFFFFFSFQKVSLQFRKKNLFYSSQTCTTWITCTPKIRLDFHSVLKTFLWAPLYHRGGLCKVPQWRLWSSSDLGAVN